MKSWRGWTEGHVRNYVRCLIAKNGVRMAARLCGVSVGTLIKFCQEKPVTLGVIVTIAETMP
jgi:hypothetical protein